MNHKHHWIIVRETEGQQGKTKRIEYTADATLFDVDSLLSETEDGLFQLMQFNIAYDLLPAGDFHAKVKFLSEHNIDELVGGIARRLAEWDSLASTNAVGCWSDLYSVPSTAEATAFFGQVVGDKSGIKVLRLNNPVELDGK